MRPILMAFDMDKRITKPVASELAAERRQALYRDVASGAITIGQAVHAMRKISRLTQPEFAKHRGISVQALRQIETETGNPTVETLNKVASIFGLQVVFVPIPRKF
jgi:DNA-binding XRE family transcriptional regulator